MYFAAERIEKFLNHRLKLKADDVYDVVNVDEDEV